MVADFLICRALMVIGHAFLNQPPLWKPHIERWPVMLRCYTRFYFLCVTIISLNYLNQFF